MFKCLLKKNKKDSYNNITKKIICKIIFLFLIEYKYILLF